MNILKNFVLKISRSSQNSYLCCSSRDDTNKRQQQTSQMIYYNQAIKLNGAGQLIREKFL